MPLHPYQTHLPTLTPLVFPGLRPQPTVLGVNLISRKILAPSVQPTELPKGNTWGDFIFLPNGLLAADLTPRIWISIICPGYHRAVPQPRMENGPKQFLPRNTAFSPVLAHLPSPWCLLTAGLRAPWPSILGCKFQCEPPA